MENKIVVDIDPVVFSVINDELHVLLIKRDKEPFAGKWALPGGIVNPQQDASLKKAVNRILIEKTGVKVNYIEQLNTLGQNDLDPRGWTVSVSYLALVNKQDITSVAQWIPVNLIEQYDLGFPHHKKIIETGLERLSNKVNYSTLPIYLMEDKFTLPKLQKIYEVIFKKKLDKSTFRQKIIETGVIRETGERTKNVANRPSLIYEKTKEAPVLFRSNFVK